MGPSEMEIGESGEAASLPRARSDPELDALLQSADSMDMVLISELLHRLLLCVHESHNAAALSD